MTNVCNKDQDILQECSAFCRCRKGTLVGNRASGTLVLFFFRFLRENLFRSPPNLENTAHQNSTVPWSITYALKPLPKMFLVPQKGNWLKLEVQPYFRAGCSRER